MVEEEIRKLEEEYAQNLLKAIQEWESSRPKLVLEYLKKQGIEISLENIPKIVNSTRFSEMSKPENSRYCQLYNANSRCHPEIENLNCLLCACPYFDTKFLGVEKKEDYKILVGRCQRPDNKGRYHFGREYPRVGVWDCDVCPIHHDPKEIELYLIQNLDQLKKDSS